MMVTVAKAQTSFNDDFESYTVGSLVGATSPTWRTWSGQVASEDVAVVNNDNHTAGGTKSIYLSSTASGGGPQDLVLPFGGVQTSGIFTYSSWFKVPTNKSAYFNFQGTAVIGGTYAMDCYMDASGSLRILNGTVTKLTSTYPQGTWFELKVVANLTVNSWAIYVNGVSQGSFSSVANKVSFIDIYPANASADFWVDDVHYDIVPYTLPTLNGAANALIIDNGLVGQTRIPKGVFKNVGVQTITSFDVALVTNGIAAPVQNITGVNIASLASYNVTFPSVTLATGAVNYAFVVSNVNGAGADGNPADDTNIVVINAITPAVGKVVAVEEGTGTWCGWCPRGAIAMDAMNKKYDSYFAGMAVHNGVNDPMKNVVYDAGVGALISGYPSALVDRGAAIDPAAMEADILQRVQIAPSATFLNGATFNTTTRVLKVSLTTTIQTAITGNYKVACVLTEDSVTGTTAGYAQTNYYAVGGSGAGNPLPPFNSLPNPVPANLMNYNHVAREITPSFNGLSNAYGSAAAAGTVVTHNFTYTLPASWDASQIHINGLFIDPSGAIDNASHTSIADAVANGFVLGSEVSSGVAKLNQVDAKVNLFPNPSKGNTEVSINLNKGAEVKLAVYQINGALVAEKNYGQLSGALSLPINSSNFNAGMYFVKVTIDGTTSVLKFVKE
jgi:Outer membrane protein Omp28/Secretion system C-terminal sorting domain